MLNNNYNNHINVDVGDKDERIKKFGIEIGIIIVQ